MESNWKMLFVSEHFSGHDLRHHYSLSHGDDERRKSEIKNKNVCARQRAFRTHTTNRVSSKMSAHHPFFVSCAHHREEKSILARDAWPLHGRLVRTYACVCVCVRGCVCGCAWVWHHSHCTRMAWLKCRCMNGARGEHMISVMWQHGIFASAGMGAPTEQWMSHCLSVCVWVRVFIAWLDFMNERVRCIRTQN